MVARLTFNTLAACLGVNKTFPNSATEKTGGVWA